MSHIVFVYGTLKRGYGNNQILRRHGAGFLSTATTTRTWRMWASGFPMIKPAAGPGSGFVTGELYEVDRACLADLDRLEGNGSMYQRQLITVRREGKAALHAEGYVWLHDTDTLMPVKPDATGLITWNPRAVRWED